MNLDTSLRKFVSYRHIQKIKIRAVREERKLILKETQKINIRIENINEDINLRFANMNSRITKLTIDPNFGKKQHCSPANDSIL